MNVTLYKHQQRAVDELANGKVLRGDPGVGKSFTALAYFFTKECGGVLNDWGSLQTPKDIYIITTAKKRDSGDWQTDCYKLGLMEDPSISVSGIRVVVDSWQNIEKYLGVKDAFFIFDEQKAIGSGKWAKTFVKIAKVNRWIMLTGTPGDIWMDYIHVFIANGFYKNITEFKKIHVEYDPWTKFPKIKRYHKVGQLVRLRNDLLVEMLYQRHTTRHLEVVVVAHDEDELERVTKRRWNVYESRPLRDAAELFAVSRKVVNSDPSRLEKLRALQAKHKRLIVFYNFDYELEMLRTLGGPNTSRHTHPTKNDSIENDILGDGQTTQPHLTLVPPMLTTNGSVNISTPSLSTSSVEALSSLSPLARARRSSSRAIGPQKPFLSGVSSTLPRSTEADSKTRPGPASTLETEVGLGTNEGDDSWNYLLSPEGMSANSTMMSSGEEPIHISNRVRTSFVELGSSPTDPSTKPRGDTGSTELLSSLKTSTDAAKSPTHHPEGPLSPGAMENMTENSMRLYTTMDSETRLRHLYDRPSKSKPMDEFTKKRLTRLLSGPGFSVIEPEEIQMMLSGELPQLGGSTTGIGITSVKTEESTLDTEMTNVVVAEWNGHKHQPVPETDEWIYLVQYMAGAEAWNCTETDAMAFYSLTYSYKQLEQAQGRIDRLNTPFTDLWYYLLYSDSWIDKAIKKALDLKQDFNEARARAKIGPMRDAA